MSVDIAPFAHSQLWEGERANAIGHRAIFVRMNERFLAALRKHHGKHLVHPSPAAAKPKPTPSVAVPPLPPSKPTEPLSVGLLEDLDEAELVQIKAILRRESVRCVVDAISKQTGVPSVRIVSVSRNKEVVAARQWAFFELQAAGFSLTQMGRMFKKDHTTILHGIRKHRERTGMRA